MSDGTKIEWTHRPGTIPSTMNALVGCQKVSRGCQHCYAIEVSHIRAGNLLPVMQDKFAGTTRSEGGKRVWTGKVTLTEKALLDPLKKKKPRTYFVNSLSDLFYEEVPDDWVDRHFAVFALCRQHTFIILTKRPKRMLEYMKSREWRVPLPNVWLGTSCEDQKTADERIPYLLQTPAAIRFISAEPLVGRMDIRKYLWYTCSVCCKPVTVHKSLVIPVCPDHGQIRANRPLDWAITGGESGKDATPMHPDWPRELRDQCKAAMTPFFFKQWGEWLPLTDYDPFVHGMKADKYAHEFAWRVGAKNDAELPISCYRVGKKSAGHLLNGKVYQEFPDPFISLRNGDVV